MVALTVRMLGGLRLEYDGAIVQLASARVRAIVAYLLLHRDRPHERARLAFLLWSESDEGQARTNLRQALYQLRHSLPQAEHYLDLDGQWLQWREDATCELDVARFEAAVVRAEQAQDAEDVTLERAWLDEAVRLYRGDLLPEMYDAWVEDARERLRGSHAGVLERLVTLAEGQRDYRAAVRYTRRLVQHDPLVEAPYRRLMRLHALCGERAKALHTYHTCVSLLQRELGIEPTGATLAAYEQVLQRDPEGGPGALTRADDTRHAALATVAPLVGRSPEMARLRTAWQSARAGRALLVLVTGDSGIGKTRLVEEYARGLLRREALRVAVRCYAAEGALAFAPVTALLRGALLAAPSAELDPVWRGEVSRLLPELADDRSRALGPLTENWQRQRLFEALARVALAHHQPMLAMIDDLQWCDRDTLEWLHFLLRFDLRAQLLVLATARTHEIGANAALVGLLAALRSEELMREVELGPLSEVETGMLARSLWRADPKPEALTALFEETEGNPLFVVEMLRDGWIERSEDEASTGETHAASLPPKLRAVISSRLEQLSPPSFALVSIAAVIGREFGFELLVKVSRQRDEEVVRGLDELWQRRIVREVGAGQYDFSHDKLRLVAYGALSLTRRRLLHRHTAEALENLAGGESGQIAYHYDLAGSPERAIPYYRQAAEAARALYASEEAVKAYRRALVLLDGLPASEAFTRWRDDVGAQLLEGLGDVFALQGLHEAARERFAGALARTPVPERISRARLWRKIGSAWVAQYDYGEALAAFEAAEAELGPGDAGDGSAWWREWIDLGLARSDRLHWQREWDENERVLKRMETAVKRRGTALERGQVYARLGFAIFARGGFVHSDEAVARLRAALAEAEVANVAGLTIIAHFLLGFALLWQDDRSEAQTQLDKSLAASELVGNAVMRVSCLTYLSFAHRLAGTRDATRAYADRALEAATALPMPEYAGAAHGQLAWLAWRGEDLATCEREGEAALACWRSGRWYPLQWSARLPLMAVRLRQGRHEEALACAAPLLEPDRQRLPNALTEALACALQAAGEPEVSAALQRAVAVAEAEGLL